MSTLDQNALSQWMLEYEKWRKESDQRYKQVYDDILNTAAIREENHKESFRILQTMVDTANEATAKYIANNITETQSQSQKGDNYDKRVL